MKQAKPIVHCIYTESNKSLTQLLDEYVDTAAVAVPVIKISFL